MAYGKVDIARSIRRYLSLLWDEDSGWTLRIARRLVADDDRPVLVVLLGKKTIKRARASRNQGSVEESVPVTIYAYPEVGTDEMLASAAADAIADQLEDVFTIGLSPGEDEKDPPWFEKAGPFRIPLWDYAEAPLEGDKRAGPDEPHDVIWVDPDSLSADNLEDPEDGKRRTVVCEFRASIERPGRIEPEGPPVGSMPGDFKPLGSGEL